MIHDLHDTIRTTSRTQLAARRAIASWVADLSTVPKQVTRSATYVIARMESTQHAPTVMLVLVERGTADARKSESLFHIAHLLAYMM